MDDCIFCQIGTGERDAHVLVETDSSVAFLDENPASLGHALVIPKPHCEFLFRDESLFKRVFQTTKRVQRSIDQVLAPDGISLFYTSGPLAGAVSHAHVHLVPRYQHDEINIALARGELDKAESEKLVQELRTVV
jgi:histidine triad (HIT) family protein